jgi:outer membrane immunogenic protein
MKRILLAGAFAVVAAGQALAADLPPPMAPPPRAPATYMPAPVPYYNWGGIYFGLNAGYGFGTSAWNSSVAPSPTVGTPGTGNFTTQGFLGGGTVGFNYQWAAIVAGLEGDFDWTNLNGSTSASGSVCAPAGTSCQTSASWLATARGRLGYAFDRVLVYATGGAAFTNDTAKGSIVGLSSTTTTTNVGWTGGAGVEVAIAPNWTAKVEYLYAMFPNGTYNIPVTATTSTTGSVKFQENIVRAGVNFKFML